MLFTIISLFLYSCKTTQNYDYELVAQGVGSQGSKLVKVFSYAKTQKKALEKAKYNAVHGLLTKGIVAGNGAYGTKPLMKPDEITKNSSFLEDFFKKGEYLQFVNISNDGTVSSKDRIKIGNQYKIGVLVSINESGLRKYLESKGIIKKMGSIFD